VSEKLAESVREIIRTELGLAADHPIEDDWPLYSLGADSLDHVEVAIALEERFGVKITPAMTVPMMHYTVPFFVDKILEGE
jgi:acyl carrier protein